MRVTTIALVFLCLSIAGNADSEAQNDGKPEQSTNIFGQGLVDACVSRYMDVSVKQITDLRAEGFTDPDIATACAISIKSAHPISAVTSRYKTVGDWKQVAAAYNLSMADLVAAPVSSSSDKETFNTEFFSRYYSIPCAHLAQVRRRGCSWEELNMCANAALCARRPLVEITELRHQGLSWSEIANRYNMRTDALMTPARLKVVSVGSPTPAATFSSPAKKRNANTNP